MDRRNFEWGLALALKKQEMKRLRKPVSWLIEEMRPMRPPVEVWRAIAAIAGRDWRWARRQAATGQNLFPPRIVAGVVLADVAMPPTPAQTLPPIPAVDAPQTQPPTPDPAPSNSIALDEMTLAKVAISAWLNHRGLQDEVAALLLQALAKGWARRARLFASEARTLGIAETNLIDRIIEGTAPPRPTPVPAALRERLEAIEGGAVTVG